MTYCGVVMTIITTGGRCKQPKSSCAFAETSTLVCLWYVNESMIQETELTLVAPQNLLIATKRRYQKFKIIPYFGICYRWDEVKNLTLKILHLMRIAEARIPKARG